MSVGDFLFFSFSEGCSVAFLFCFFACAEDFSGISIFLLFVYPFCFVFDLHVFVLFKFSNQTCVLCAVEKATVHDWLELEESPLTDMRQENKVIFKSPEVCEWNFRPQVRVS